MTTAGAPPTGEPVATGDRRRRFFESLSVVLVAVLGHVLVVDTWWFHDDWVFLADAAGIAERGDSLVRVVSYRWYWHLFYPLFGLATWPWALTRLAMHAGSSLLTVRLAGHAGLDRHGRLLAGLLFAAAPAAFESLYWGTGAVELLGVLCSLAALERWLAGGTRACWTALGLTALAIGCKEAGLLLPLVFAADLGRRRAWRSPLWGGLAGVAALGVVAVALMLGDFTTTTDYAVDLRLVPRNFLVYGSWLATPSPLLKDATLGSVVGLATGAALWLVWGWTARRAIRRGRPALAVCLGLAVLAIVPATVLGDHAVPRYVYGPFAALAIACVLVLYPDRGPSRRSLALFAVLFLVVTWTGVEYHRRARYFSGRAYHRLVFKENVSRHLCTHFRLAGLAPDERVVIVQDPGTDDEMKRYLQIAMADDLALKLIAGPEATLVWVRELAPEHVGSVVYRTKQATLELQGRLTLEE